MKLLMVKLRCWLLHRSYHEYKPINHSYWRICEKCRLGVLVRD